MENIGREFQAPLSPIMDGLISTSIPNSSSLYGSTLAENISCFYAWYLAWDRAPSVHAEHYQLLSQINRIACVCMQGGAFLADNEEKLALESLNDLKSGLFDGTVQQREIPDYLRRMISDLTFVNHKARLVSHTTELEYRLCIHPPEHQDPEITETMRLLLNQIIHGITPTLQDRDAQAIDQEIAQILKNLSLSPDAHRTIHQSILKWMSG